MKKLMPAAEVLGNLVGENLRDLYRELDEARHTITSLLDTAGRPGHCPSCGMKVTWIPRRGHLSEVPCEHDGRWHKCRRFLDARPREEP